MTGPRDSDALDALDALAGAPAAAGTVYLVGGGPGDPGLATLRAARLLATCDVVVYDRLAPPELLGLARDDADLIDVGKRPRIEEVDQDAINELLVDKARRGRAVVRLKGGDPFVFGRGGEEARALSDAGLAWEVVPGVSAAVAAPAYAGIPVTLRGVSESVTIVTGHGEDGSPGVPWEQLAATGGTLVVLMGVTHREEITRRLLAGGRSPDTPVAAVRWGTRPDQRTVRTTLRELADVEIRPPATIVIGEVAESALDWFRSRPLVGKSVVVTRSRRRASALSSLLRARGAAVVEFPVIETIDPDDGGRALAAALAEVSSYAWLVVTSPNGAERVVSTFRTLGRDLRALAGVKVAAIGPGTAEVLAGAGIVADLVPPEYVAEALVDAFPTPPSPPPSAPASPPSRRVLLARAAVARDIVPEGLAAKGWQVDEVAAYRTVHPPVPPAGEEALRGADVVTFTSSSTVEGFLSAAGPELLPPAVACIGPVTAATARAAGITVDVVAGEHSIEGLVDAICEWAAGSRIASME